MPGWDETENEIRYRIRDPAVFTPGSFFVKDLQKNPRNYAVFGRMKGEETSTMQALRFPKENWSLAEAKKWYAEHKDTITKAEYMAGPDVAESRPDLPGIMAAEEEKKKKKEKAKEEVQEVQKSEKDDLDLAFFEKASLTVQAMVFKKSEFTEAAVQKWLVVKNMDVSTIKKTSTTYSVAIRDEDQFISGSLRDIVLRKGITATVGLVKQEFKKSIIKRIPDRFALKAEDLNNLEDLDIVEITLTRSPAVGKMAEFRILKSADTDQNYTTCVPFRKFNNEKMQVGAYALVPDLPDYQGDMLSIEEVEKAAHKFLANLSARTQRGSGTGLEHGVFDGIGYPIESFVDRDGKHGIKGGWWVESQVTDSDTWQSIRKGEIIGYSIGGSGKRKRASFGIDTPMAKTEELAESIVTKVLKALGLKKEKEKEQTVNADVAKTETIKKEETEEETIASKEEDMKLEVLKKYNLKPTEVEELEKAGVDVAKALEGCETMMKAAGFNFSLEGIGHLTKTITSVVRSNSGFGKWPTPAVAWNSASSMRKAAGTPAQGDTPPEPPAEGSELEIAGAEKALQKMASLMEDLAGQNKALAEQNKGLSERLENLETRRGVRKSTDVVPTGQPQQVQTEGWGELDAYNVSYGQSREELKKSGIDPDAVIGI